MNGQTPSAKQFLDYIVGMGATFVTCGGALALLWGTWGFILGGIFGVVMANVVALAAIRVFGRWE